MKHPIPSMVVMGIDPGSHRVGYAFLVRQDKDKGRIPSILEYGTIEVPPKTPSPENLLLIQARLAELVERFHPNHACVENLFFSRNKKTAQQVYEARGVILFCLAQFGIPIAQLTANQIKKGISASGKADKKAIRKSVQVLFGLDPEGHDDSWDAIACAFVGFGLVG